MNTWFEKAQKYLITFRAVGNEDFKPPYTTKRFGQLDYIMAKKQWKNTVEDVNTTEEIAI